MMAFRAIYGQDASTPREFAEHHPQARSPRSFDISPTLPTTRATKSNCYRNGVSLVHRRRNKTSRRSSSADCSRLGKRRRRPRRGERTSRQRTLPWYPGKEGRHIRHTEDMASPRSQARKRQSPEPISIGACRSLSSTPFRIVLETQD